MAGVKVRCGWRWRDTLLTPGVGVGVGVERLVEEATHFLLCDDTHVITVTLWIKELFNTCNYQHKNNYTQQYSNK